MANSLYDLGRKLFLDGGCNWGSDTIKLAFLSSGYTVNIATHQYVSDLGANIVARSGAFSGKTTTSGIANASNVTVSSVTGSQINYFVIYRDTGVDSTSALLVYFDTATNMPLTPNGGDITVTWDTGTNKIFKL